MISVRRRIFFAFFLTVFLALDACGVDERDLSVEEPDTADSGDAVAPGVDASTDARADARSDASVSSEASTRDVTAETPGAPDQTLGAPDQTLGAPDQASAREATTESAAPARDAAADAVRDAPVAAEAEASLTAASLALAAAMGSAANFGNVTVGTTRDGTFVLSNSGQQATGIGIGVTGAGFARLVGVANECGTTIAGGGSCNIGVRFTASTLGAQTGSLAVTASAGTAPAPISLSATSVCAAGQMACAGTCIATATDPDNCGRCNHGCLTGGTCSGSICQPITFVAAGQTSNVVDIASDGNVVVWADSGSNTINQVGSPGATKIVLGSSPTVTAPLNVGIDAASGTIFWAQQDGTIGSATRGLAGSAELTGCTGLTPVAAINVGFSNSVDVLSVGFLATCSITLGTPGSGILLADTNFPSNAVGRTLTSSRFMGDVQNQAVLQLGVSGDFNPVILATIPMQSSALYVVQDSSFVYWSAATGGGPAILRVPLATPTAMLPQTILANAGGTVGGMTTDGVNVYFQNGNGIFYIPVAGATTATRLTTQNGLFLKYASGAVYFASGGAIFKIATP